MSSVAVFLGAKDPVRSVFKEGAEYLGKTIAEQGVELVYGGSNTGLMKRLADAAIQAGGKVTGVTVHALADREAPHPNLTQLYRVDTMHERKAKMAELADAFIVFPGGIGTLEEFFEVYTWARLGFHRKPVGLLNLDGFYDPLLQLLENAVKEGFIDPAGVEMLICEGEIEALMARLRLV